MRDQFKGPRKKDTGRPEILRPRGAEDWARLEEIGDLHFHASAYSSALDYYWQILDPELADVLPDSTALRVLRKTIDGTILLGDLDAAEALIDRGVAILADDPDGGQIGPAAVFGAVFQGRRSIILRERGQVREALDGAAPGS